MHFQTKQFLHKVTHFWPHRSRPVNINTHWQVIYAQRGRGGGEEGASCSRLPRVALADIVDIVIIFFPLLLSNSFPLLGVTVGHTEQAWASWKGRRTGLGERESGGARSVSSRNITYL